MGTDSPIREVIIWVDVEIEPEGDDVDMDSGLNEAAIEMEIMGLEDSEGSS